MRKLFGKLVILTLAVVFLCANVAPGSASDQASNEEEAIIEVIPFGSDHDTAKEKLHEHKLHSHPNDGITDPHSILKKKETPRFQLYYPGNDKRVGLKIKIRLWTFKPDKDGVVKRFYIKPKISDEPRLMFTFKF